LEDLGAVMMCIHRQLKGSEHDYRLKNSHMIAARLRIESAARKGCDYRGTQKLSDLLLCPFRMVFLKVGGEERQAVRTND